MSTQPIKKQQQQQQPKRKQEEEEEVYESIFEQKTDERKQEVVVVVAGKDYDYDDDDDEDEEDDEDFTPDASSEEEEEEDEEEDDEEVDEVDTRAIVNKAKQKKEKQTPNKKPIKQVPTTTTSVPSTTTTTTSSMKPIPPNNPTLIKFDENWTRTIKDEKSNTSSIYFVTSGTVYLHPKPFPPQIRTKDKTEEEIKKHKQHQVEWLDLLHPCMVTCLECIDPKTADDDVPERLYKFKIFDCKYSERECKKEWFIHLANKYPEYLQEAISCHNIRPCSTNTLNGLLKSTSKKVQLYQLLMPEKIFDELTKKKTTTTPRRKTPSKKSVGAVSEAVARLDLTQYHDYFKTLMGYLADKCRLDVKDQKALSQMHAYVTTNPGFLTSREAFCMMYSYILVNGTAFNNQLESADAIRRKTYNLCTYTTKDNKCKIIAPFIDFTVAKQQDDDDEDDVITVATAAASSSSSKKTPSTKIPKKKKKTSSNMVTPIKVEMKKKKRKIETKDDDEKKKTKRHKTSSSSSSVSSQIVVSAPPRVIEIADLDDTDLIH